MPDDERKARRAGDETRERIAGLASGWEVDAPATPEPPRKKPKTAPPPAPGSAERKALDEELAAVAAKPAAAKIETKPPSAKPDTKPPSPPAPAKVETKPPPPPAADRAKPATAPPPIPASARAKLPTAPPPPPIPARLKPPSGAPPPPDQEFVRERTPPVIIDPDLGVLPADGKLAVPVGEFDSGVATIDQGKLVAHAQATVKRDAADGLLRIEGNKDAHGDPTTIDNLALDRGDPTKLGGEPREVTATGGTLRARAALRRQRGLVGDVRYIATALFGVRRARRELGELEARQETRQNSRRRHLVTLGRTAITADAFEHDALAAAREQLLGVEDERSRHAAAVAAADGELDRVRRDRDAAAKQHATDVAALDAELAELAKKLEPLEKEQAGVNKRATELRETLQRVEKRITETEALLVSVKAEKMDRAEIQAELATLKADRIAVKRDEPTLAAELDALNPRIAAIEAARAETRKKRKERDDAEAEDKRRTAELLDAIGAKRKVVERAAADAEGARDRVLFELGERLYVDRPKILGAQLSPIDQIDLELGEGDRRVMELREILSNIDKAKLARGIAAVSLAVLLLGGFVVWLVMTLA